LHLSRKEKIAVEIKVEVRLSADRLLNQSLPAGEKSQDFPDP
jgi:hypothetical protein